MKKEIHEFLSFFGAGRPPVAPFTWDLRQLQYASIYFSMSGEDAVLRQAFKHRIAEGKPGRYVDVGCATPVHISNTYLLYALGWRGVAVDANPAFAEDWAAARPRDVFENVAIGQTPGQVFWFKHLRNIGMSRIAGDNASPGPEFSDSGAPVKIERLDTLFARHFSDGEIDLLSIDIEGAELDALMSNDWARWRPGVIIMEAHGFSFDAPRDDRTIDYLYRQDYHLVEKIGANVVLCPA